VRAQLICIYQIEFDVNGYGKPFAIAVPRTFSQIRYLRLKRMDTGEMQILPITHAILAPGLALHKCHDIHNHFPLANTN